MVGSFGASSIMRFTTGSAWVGSASLSGPYAATRNSSASERFGTVSSVSFSLASL